MGPQYLFVKITKKLIFKKITETTEAREKNKKDLESLEL
jgi:hypothetical protein